MINVAPTGTSSCFPRAGHIFLCDIAKLNKYSIASKYFGQKKFTKSLLRREWLNINELAEACFISTDAFQLLLKLLSAAFNGENIL